MPFECAREVFIESSPDRIWDVLADLEKWPAWTASMTSILVVDPGPLRVGSRVRIQQPRLPASMLTITNWMPGAGFEWSNRSPGLCTTAAHWIHPVGNSCRVELWIRFQGVLAPVVRRFLGTLIEGYVELEAEGLKRRCENPFQAD